MRRQLGAVVADNKQWATAARFGNAAVTAPERPNKVRFLSMHRYKAKCPQIKAKTYNYLDYLNLLKFDCATAYKVLKRSM